MSSPGKSHVCFTWIRYNKGSFSALETGSAPLKSVVLEVYDSMSYAATRTLQKFLISKSLNSLFLRICGFIMKF